MHDHTTIPEEWRPVVGYEDSYEVSNLGRVRSVRILKPVVVDYPRVTLCRRQETKHTPVLIHHLVAAAFLPAKPTPKHEINHKNGVKADARADNLEWVTRAENCQHAFDTGLRGPGNTTGRGNQKLTEANVMRIHELVAEGHNDPTIAALYSVDKSTIALIRQGKTWRHLRPTTVKSVGSDRDHRASRAALL